MDPLYDKGVEQLRGGIKLRIWYLRRLRERDGIPLETGLKKHVELLRMIDFKAPGAPDRAQLIRLLEGLFEEHAGRPDRLEEAGLQLLWPHAEASIQRDLSALRENLGRSFAGFTYEFHAFFSDLAGDDHLTLHFRNGFIPDSPFQHMAELARGLWRITERSARERPEVTWIQCATSINSHAGFGELFPPAWTRDATPGPPGPHMGWWGQFIDRTWGFNQRMGERFRKSGKFPLMFLHCRCEIAALRDHLQARWKPGEK